jgi:hypothetical protein
MIAEAVIGFCAFVAFTALIIRLIVKNKRLGIDQDMGFLAVCILYAIYSVGNVLYPVASLYWLLDPRSYLQFFVCNQLNYKLNWLALTSCSIT